MAEHGDQPVARRPAGDALPHRLDHAGNLAARRERPLGPELIFVLDDQHVGIVDRAGPDVDQQLARAGDGIGKLGELERLGAAGGAGEERLHRAEAGKAGSLATSAGSCWMMTRARKLRPSRSNRSIEASVSARLVLNGGTPRRATCSVKW